MAVRAAPLVRDAAPHPDTDGRHALPDTGCIAAVFDFEFAAPDTRAIDVASGLVFTMRIWECDEPTALLMARRFRDGLRV